MHFGRSAIVIVVRLLGIASAIWDGVLHISNGTHILTTAGPANDFVVAFHKGVHKAAALATDSRKGLLFYSETSRGHEGIYKVKLASRHASLIVKDVVMVVGLTVDWNVRLLYWTDERRACVELADYAGHNRKTLFDTGLKWPRGIVADPVGGYLYWADQGTKKIERSRLDGSDRTTIVSRHLGWPNQLAFHHRMRRLFWADGLHNTIMSYDIRTMAVTLHRNLSAAGFVGPLFGLAVSERHAFVSQWHGGVHIINLRHDDRQQYTTLASGLGDGQLFSLALLQTTTRRRSKNACGGRWRGGCSHLCLSAGPTASPRCSCPTDGGLALGRDRKTCGAPEAFLLFADKHANQVKLVAPDEGSLDWHVVARSSRPHAVVYDPVERVAYWSDVQENTISWRAVDGSRGGVLLNASHGLGNVQGLDIDWLHRRLYFTNSWTTPVHLDGAVVERSSLESIDLDGTNRLVLLAHLQQPVAVCVDVNNSTVYVLDSGTATLWRSDLDGFTHSSIPGASLSSPHAMSCFNNTIYILNDRRESIAVTTQLRAYDTLSGTWSTTRMSGAVLGLTAFGEGFFKVVLRGNSTHVLQCETVTDSVECIVRYSGSPLSLFYVYNTRYNDAKSSACKRNECGGVCIPLPNTSTVPPTETETSHNNTTSPSTGPVGYRCTCPDLRFATLYNWTKCEAPKKFVLFADSNTINLISLDGHLHNQRVQRVIIGDVGASYVALTLDHIRNIFYFSDITRGLVLWSDLAAPAARRLVAVGLVVEGLALDDDGLRLYLTAYDRRTMAGAVYVRSLAANGDDHHLVELVSGLRQPRAVAVDSANGVLYWTEYGGGAGRLRPRVCRSELDGSDVRVLKDTALRWPNALSIDAHTVYFADGYYSSIESRHYESGEWERLLVDGQHIDHVFGMAVRGRQLFYTSWWSRHLAVISLDSARVSVLATHLHRPTAIAVRT